MRPGLFSLPALLLCFPLLATPVMDELDEGEESSSAEKSEATSSKFSANFELLYGKVLTSLPVLAQATQGFTPPITNMESTSAITLSSPDAYGFRFGVGYELAHDSWDLCATWQRITPKRSCTLLSNSPNLIPLLIVKEGEQQLSQGGLRASGLDASWKLFSDRLNLSLLKSHKVSASFCAKPEFGLTFLSTDEKLDVEYKNLFAPTALPPFGLTTPVGDRSIRSKTSFLGLGPLLGGSVKWSLTKHFALLSEMHAALIWGTAQAEYTIDVAPVTGGPATSSGTIKRAANSRLLPLADLFVGIDMTLKSKQERYALNVALGYQTEYIWQKESFASVQDFDYRRSSAMHAALARLRLNF